MGWDAYMMAFGWDRGWLDGCKYGTNMMGA